MNKTIRIIGAPVDLGQSQRGVDMGPSAIRYAGLSSQLRELNYNITDAGNIQVPVKDSLNETNLMPEICRIYDHVYKAGREAISQGSLPIFLGGDHSISIGTIGGITHDSPAGVIWIDAHGDYNTPETSLTGNIHGMALAILTGKGIPDLINIGRPGPALKPQDIVIIGLRKVDYEERDMLKKSGIAIYSMRDIDAMGINVIAKKALEHLKHLSRIHISLDMDSLDIMEAPGVGTPVPGGLTYREAHLIMEIIADSQRFSSMDIVEINPIKDKRNQTAKIAVELALSLFGKSIL